MSSWNKSEVIIYTHQRTVNYPGRVCLQIWIEEPQACVTTVHFPTIVRPPVADPGPFVGHQQAGLMAFSHSAAQEIKRFLLAEDSAFDQTPLMQMCGRMIWAEAELCEKDV